MATAAPIFTVRSVEEACDFYRRVLGAGGPGPSPAGRFGRVIHGEVDFHGLRLMFTPDDGPPGSEAIPYRRRAVTGQGQRGAGMSVYVWLQADEDVDALHERIRDAGATVLVAPHDQPFGARLFAVEDPDGYVVTFSQRAKRA